jgi:hypothetical protein
MGGRTLNKQQRDALFRMRHRKRSDLRALKDSGVSEAEMEDLVDGGYVEIVDHRHLAWALTAMGKRWVDRNLA